MVAGRGRMFRMSLRMSPRVQRQLARRFGGGRMQPVRLPVSGRHSTHSSLLPTSANSRAGDDAGCSLSARLDEPGAHFVAECCLSWVLTVVPTDVNGMLKRRVSWLHVVTRKHSGSGESSFCHPRSDIVSS